MAGLDADGRHGDYDAEPHRRSTARAGPSPAERWNVGHRIRDVEVAPDGTMWMLEDSTTGGLFKVTPK